MNHDARSAEEPTGAQLGPDGPHMAFVDLHQNRCLELLSDHTMGRIAWRAEHGPQLYPISYFWDDQQIAFRTSPHGVLSELVQPTDVVLEVDDLDQLRHTGWSVIVRGRTRGISAPTSAAQLNALARATPWISGARDVFIGITPNRVSGRSFLRRSGDEDR